MPLALSRTWRYSTHWGTVLSQGIFYDSLPRVPLVELGPLVVWKEGVFWNGIARLSVLQQYRIDLSTLSVVLHAV